MRAPRAGGGPEQLLLDGPALAAGKPYFSFGETHHSPDHRLYAYTVDETGSETYDLRIRDIRVGARPAGRHFRGCFASPGRRTAARCSMCASTRIIGRASSTGTAWAPIPRTMPLVYEEKDLGFEVSVSSTRSRRFVVISTAGGDTSEERLIDAAQPEARPGAGRRARAQLRYDTDDWGDRLVIRTNADGADDFKIVTAPASAPGRENWRDLIAHQDGRRIVEVVAFAGHLVRVEREDGLERVVVHRRSDGSEHAVTFGEEAYSVRLDLSYEFDTRTIRFEYSSPATPKQTFDYDVESRERVLRKQQKIPSGHDPAAYVVRRLHVTTADNEQVPITLLHRKDLPLDGSAPLFLEGYGAYSFVFPSCVRLQPAVAGRPRLRLRHRACPRRIGERRALAQCRPPANKANTFNDFIAVAEHLINAGYTAPGGSSRAAIPPAACWWARSPTCGPTCSPASSRAFRIVDALNTMLDESLPLTVGDFPECGNPIEDVAAYRNMASYAPYENVAAQAYPHMLVTAGMSDPRVQYWEPAKWVAKIRAMKTNDARIVLITRISAGHFGAAGRFEGLEELGAIQAFALDATGMHRSNEAAPRDISPAGRTISPNVAPIPAPAATPLPSTIEPRQAR